MSGHRSRRVVAYYAFDVITAITFSDRLGFVEERKDINGIIHAIEGRLAYNCVVGEVPVMQHILLANRFVSAIANMFPSIARLNCSGHITNFALAQLERYRSKARGNPGQMRDMLARFQQAKDHGKVSDEDVLAHAISNM